MGATFPAGKVTWPTTYTAQQYQTAAGYQPTSRPGTLPVYSYPPQVAPAEQRDESSPPRDRSPLRRERRYSGTEDRYWDKERRDEDWYRREDERYRQDEQYPRDEEAGRDDRYSKDRRKDRYSRDREGRHSREESRARDKTQTRELKRAYDIRKQKEELDREKERLKWESRKHDNTPPTYKGKPTKDYPGAAGTSSSRSSHDDSRSRRSDKHRYNPSSSHPVNPEDRYDSSKPRSSRQSSSAPQPVKIKTEPEDGERTQLSHEEIIAQEKKVWIRSAPADLYYQRDADNPAVMRATERSLSLHKVFEERLLKDGAKAREKFPTRDPPGTNFTPGLKPCCGSGSDSSESEDEDAGNFRVGLRYIQK